MGGIYEIPEETLKRRKYFGYFNKRNKRRNKLKYKKLFLT